MSWIALRVPVIVLVLAATAVPVELRAPRAVAPGLDVRVSDVAANVAGYMPVGFVLGGLGWGRAVVAAASISALAETSQLVMRHRVPSIIDVASNVTGAILGAALAVRRGIRSPGFGADRRAALVAAMLACGLVAGVGATAGGAPSPRGATSPGTLEAHWKLDEPRGRLAVDSSGHGLHGTFGKEPRRVAGVRGEAVRLDGATGHLDVGPAGALRLAGSLTISAWINATSFPADDAAIVSRLTGSGDEGAGYQAAGYQLDATADRGPRTIGFKLGSACGHLMARYGATPLAVGRWYHVAGVYDAEARTLDVYLDGELDDGVLLGPVTGRQRSARVPLSVGSRSDVGGFEFAGALADVRIYSRPLTRAEIVADMRGAVIADSGAPRAPATHPGDPCAVSTDREDARIPGVAAALGALAAVTCVGLRPSAGALLGLGASAAAGLLLFPATVSTLPPADLAMLPLLSLAGGASVAISVRRVFD